MVEIVELFLNIDENVPLATQTPSGGHIGPSRTPAARVDVLLHLRCACHSVNLQLDEEDQLQLRLGAVLYGVVCPLHSPPGSNHACDPDGGPCPPPSGPVDGTFQMVRPLRAKEAQVTVGIQQDRSTQGLLDVLVECGPIIYEFRTEVMLQFVDFIDRLIIGVLKPLGGVLPSSDGLPKEPRWRIKVPHAVMLMPTSGEGQIECCVEDADVGCTTLLHPCLTMLITVRAKRARAFSNWPTPDGGMVRGKVPLLEELPEIAIILRIPMGKEIAVGAGMPYLALEIEVTTYTIHVALTPADVRLMVAVWFDNFSRNYLPPHDPAVPELPSSQVELCVRLHVAQVMLWFHRSAASGPVTRMQLQHIGLEVNKAIGVREPFLLGITTVDLRVRKLTSHARWRRGDQSVSSAYTCISLLVALQAVLERR